MPWPTGSAAVAAAAAVPPLSPLPAGGLNGDVPDPDPPSCLPCRVFTRAGVVPGPLGIPLPVPPTAAAAAAVAPPAPGDWLLIRG
jgi:hypothetical protein